MIVARSDLYNVCASVRIELAMVEISQRAMSEVIISKQNNAYTKFRPARPRMIRFTSRVVHPPASGVPAVKVEKKQLQICTHTNESEGNAYWLERVRDLI